MLQVTWQYLPCIKQKADKAMLTVYHRFLCTQSHLYYIHHCIVKCTVCPLLLFTVLKPPQVTLHIRSHVLQNSLSEVCFLHVDVMVNLMFFYMLLQYLTGIIFPRSQLFYSNFYPYKIDCKSSGNSLQTAFKCQLFLEMCAFSLGELVLYQMATAALSTQWLHEGALLWRVVTWSTVHSGLFCSQNTLSYSFWGLLINDYLICSGYGD